MIGFGIDAYREMVESAIKPEYRKDVKVAGCIACEELFLYAIEVPIVGLHTDQAHLPQGDPGRTGTPIVLFSPERCLCGDCRDKATPFIVRDRP